VDRGKSNRPGLRRVFAHGAPETPVLVFGWKDLSPSSAGEIPCA
jgi:hypothetical protein